MRTYTPNTPVRDATITGKRVSVELWQQEAALIYNLVKHLLNTRNYIKDELK